MLGRLPLLALTAAIAVMAPLVLAPADASGDARSTEAAETGSSVPGEPASAAASAAQFENPVGADDVPNFADPTVIRGRDGFWYAYGTGDPLYPGDDYRKMKIARSDDLVEWEYVDDVFTPETEPRYDGHGDDAFRMYWAPAVEYFDGQYLLYYSYVVNPAQGPQWLAIGVATADHPAGPWTDSGAYVTGPERWEPRPGEQAWRNVIDPEVVSTPEGERYLYYGSVNGGVTVAQLSDDGLRVTGERIPVTLENRYEGAHIVHREGYYYLFLSIIGGCCAGPVSGYPVQVARAESPTGPFYDRDGIPVLGRHAGGTPVQVPNGNRWVSVGHNTVATDLSGQQWLVTHGIDRYDPYLQGRLNGRVLVLSRLDWVDGWPTANAGQGVLDGPQAAPVAGGRVVDSFEDGALSPRVWRQGHGWTIGSEPAGGFLQSPQTHGTETLSATRPVLGDARIRGAVRLGDGTGGSAGFVLDRGATDLRVVIDRSAGEFVLEARQRGTVTDQVSQPLPTNFQYDDWHEIDLQLHGGVLEATVTHAGLDDPLAIAELDVPSSQRATRVAVVAENSSAAFDDISAVERYTPVTSTAPDPKVGELAPELSEEFDGELGEGWTAIRDPETAVDDGVLSLPVQQDELIDRRGEGERPAALLLRDTPEGEWTVETRVTIPFGQSYPRAWPQAGLLAYADDDEFVTLTYGSARRTRHVTFGKEMPWENDVVYGDARLGPTTSDTVWLRLQHTMDSETGEHQYRAATSVDGQHWVWHGVRTLPASSSPQIALAAFGAAAETHLTAEFDYLRFFRD